MPKVTVALAEEAGLPTPPTGLHCVDQAEVGRPPGAHSRRSAHLEASPALGLGSPVKGSLPLRRDPSNRELCPRCCKSNSGVDDNSYLTPI